MDAVSDDKATPGPWKAHEHGGDWYVFAGNAMVADGAIDEPWIARMRGIGRGATEAEQRANALLIAQAPDLARLLAAANQRAERAERERDELVRRADRRVAEMDAQIEELERALEAAKGEG